MKNILSTIAVSTALTVAFATPGLADNPMVGGAAMYENKNIVENAVNSADHTTLVAAVKAAGLVETLSGEGPFTVFAPTNAAFEKLPDGTVETLLKPENKDQLRTILLYHVVPGRVYSDTVVTLKGAPTASGITAPISVKKGYDKKPTVMIDNAKVVKTDIDASNGVIHVLDAVILPD